MRSAVPVVAAALFAFFEFAAMYPVALCDEADRILDIRLPQQLDPAKTIVLVGEYGNGLTISQVDGSRYTRRISKTTRSAKVLIYCPGFKLMTAEIDFTKPSPAAPLIPEPEKLPTTPLTLRIVDSDAEPVANRKVEIRQPLLEMEYFGYYDGMVWYWRAAPVASGVTDASGRLTVRVPVLVDDPAFAKYGKDKLWFYISVSESPQDRSGARPIPSTIPALRRYSRQVDIKLAHPACR